MAKSSMSVEVIGLEKLIANVDSNKLLGTSWKKGWEELSDWLLGRAVKRAPRKTGNLATHMAKNMDARPIPLWTQITNDATNGKVRYGWVLQAGHRSRRGMAGERKRQVRRKTATSEGMIPLHYAGTNKSTKNWFKGSLRGAKRKANQLLENVAKEMERKWAGITRP